MSEKWEQSQIDDVESKNELPSIRSRKRKTLDGEKTYDNQIMNSETKYMIEVYNVIMDNTVTSIEKKFLGIKKNSPQSAPEAPPAKKILATPLF